ncbi:Protein of uncharacterised function (DUF3800) [Chryseobacterium gleum]|uniref:Protein of uncharacterized function (DUF3800) n=2 Tax=Chryseobacterium gleum TaxID=250 RepID=A0A3S4M596_CHRGE|nr:DUF3800 domain-containing protein [Chryseobacterium gleum]EFK35742.1 hypothetical protein HMPREF0204_14811 [Chryseobacterium gleum ATCC 35910]QQY31479.1 DUF3800 domain-containing protein [Chryseobacterium gleum]VEE11837.1 Protein of uncharacterised function (DUF3800) [Chryseobacterium gleum]
MIPAKIFIDEFGNAHLDLSKEGTFSHFIYTSVIIKDTDIEKARKVLKDICIKYRLGENLKSSNIKNKNFKKRKDILIEFVERLDFVIDIMVVDKSKLFGEGLKIKRTFYKYFQSLFVEKYNKIYESYSINADKVGEEFKQELQDYVREKSINRDLFNQDRSFEIFDDKDEKLIQIADFISGCLGKVFCTSHFDHQYIELFNLLHARTSISYFPFESYITKEIEGKPELDRQIMRMNYQLIQKFLESTNVQKTKEKARLLEYLRFQSELNPNRLVSTTELLIYLNNFFPNIKSERVRILIRDLRYEGLFIVSHSGKPGYKLATKYSDVSEHFNHFLKYVVPMLQKVKILNETLSKNSFNDINPIEKDPNMQKLKELISGI